MNTPRVYPLLMLGAGLLIVLLMPDAASAACGGSSPNRVAASASRSDVNDCVAVAVSGDTIRVPNGTAAWSSALTLPANKDLSIIGSSVITCSGTPITCTAVNNTNISCSVCFVLDLGASHRISGFTMTAANDGGIATTSNQNLNKFFRVDHNRIVSTSGWAPMEIRGQNVAVHPQGIVDNNILVDVAIHANGTAFQLDEGDQQHQLWAQQTPLGDSTAIVYIEDNHFQNTSGNVNSTDSNYGGRYVFRFNRITSGRHTSEVHGMQGDNRGSQRTEIYHNTASGLTGFSGSAFFRGGTGVVFNNTQASAFSFGILLTNDRSELDDPIPVVGNCDGTHAGIDQNTAGQRGWRCRDQPGTSHDATKWQHSPSFGPYNQVMAPVYVWGNTTGTSAMAVEVDSTGDADLHIQANRDFYNQVTPFNGAAGVGVGPIANRSTSCTTGVAYWATDEGEWNSRRPGPDGRLYKCTSPNTWSLYYTPYLYPHPWAAQGGQGGTPPNAPSNLQVN